VWILGGLVQVVLLGLFYLPQAKVPLGDERMYLRAALAVGETGSSGLDLLWPPAYAWFLAPLVAVSGGSIWLSQAVQVGCLFLAAWFVRELVRRALDDETMANLCALLVVSYPPMAAYAHYLWPEMVHLALALSALWILVSFGPRTLPTVGAGVILGICLQLKVLLLPLLPILLVALWRLWRSRPRPRLVALASLVAAIVLTVLPTTRAHQRDFGRSVLANSGTFNVWLGLNGALRSEFGTAIVADEYRRYARSARSVERRDAMLESRILEFIDERGVWTVLVDQVSRQYFRLFDKDSFLTHQLEGGRIFERGDGYRSGKSVVAHLVRWSSHALWALVLTAAGLGFVLFPYRRQPVGWWILGLLAAQAALLLVLHVKTRYRIPMLPELFFFASWATVFVWRAARGGDRAGLGPYRWAGGALAAATLLFLAFGG